MEIKLPRVQREGYHRYFERLTNSSDAIKIYRKHTDHLFRGFTLQLSNITGGNITVQYTLSPDSEVQDNTATWYNTTAVNINTDQGIPMDSPVNLIRIVASVATVSYTVDLLY